MSCEEEGDDVYQEQDLVPEEDENEGSYVDEDEEDYPAAGSKFAAMHQAIYNADEVNVDVFEEVVVPQEIIDAVQQSWSKLLAAAESFEAAGELIYGAIFDAAPSLQGMFKTPRAVQAMRFVNSLNLAVTNLHDAKTLKVAVETLSFQHMDLEVTVPRVVIFRDSILDCLQVELGAALTDVAIAGWRTILNYIGGAFIYVRCKYNDRFHVLASSWAQANNKGAHDIEPDADTEGSTKDGLSNGVSPPPTPANDRGRSRSNSSPRQNSRKTSTSRGSGKKKDGAGVSGEGVHRIGKDRQALVPRDYNEMFLFNAAVMGFTARGWMSEVLGSFNAIVTNANNSYRFVEECDVLCLRLAKYKGQIILSEYKTVMLASLRSLVKDWGSPHEVAWSWLWENIERKIQPGMGRPVQQEAALQRFMSNVDEEALSFVRREVYVRFFSVAPGGQDFFKQSSSRLHFIVDKVLSMTLEMYQKPLRMVEDLSGLGLRHVGYGIPTDYFGPFVSSCVQVMRRLTDDDDVEEAFRWSLGLISRILTRVISEGSTLVMTAINANSARQLEKAVANAPRGERALWALKVQVGTQSISPLLWAIDSYSIDTARAMLVDLLTIRGDRDRYYYGMDVMFERHPDLIKRLCVDAPSLLPVLLDGLVWRSRFASGGLRRVNYYIKHLIVDAQGHFSPALGWMVEHKNGKIMCHPAVSFVTDLIWHRVALQTFLFGRLWFLFTLVIFVLSQAVLNHMPTDQDTGENADDVRIAIFAFRCFLYLCSMGQGLFYHTRRSVRSIRRKSYVRFGRCLVPSYWSNWQDCASLLLTLSLCLMLGVEPILHCSSGNDQDQMFLRNCAPGRSIADVYAIVSGLAMLLYFLLLSDLSVLSTRVSAYVLVCGQLHSEVSLYLFALTFFVAAFAGAVNCLDQENANFDGIPLAALNLYRIGFGMFATLHFDGLTQNPVLMICIIAYVVIVVVFLLNLLIAQLNCAYFSTYEDMIGFARLNRSRVVCETVPSVPLARWQRFVNSLGLEDRLEFMEGDLGVAGGVQIYEPASAHFTAVDTVCRFAGSTSPAARWPHEDKSGEVNEADRFDRLEKLMNKMSTRAAGSNRREHSSRGGGSVIGLELSVSQSHHDSSSSG